MKCSADPTASIIAKLSADRLAALARWRSRPSCRLADDRAALEEAAAATLIATDEGPAFETVAFDELVALVADMPF